jgi:deoxyadenosine/deoxycytidine kinase
MIFSIEGNIGSGKSTIVEALRQRLTNQYELYNYVFIQEPVDTWKSIKDENDVGILEKFYTDQEKYGFSFQMMAYISRLALIKKTIRENPDSHIITERSINTDRNVFAKMLYDDGKIEKVNYDIYMKWFDEFVEETNVDYIIYIRADAEVCFNRVLKRARNGEVIPEQYLKRCGEYHDNWLLNEKNVFSLDVNEDFTNNDMLEKWTNNIINVLYEKTPTYYFTSKTLNNN